MVSTSASYHIVDWICETAASSLYRARRLTDGMPVLLKLASEHGDAAQFDRFEREYRLLQSLNVAGVGKPLALTNERGRPALILEDFPGESLEALLGHNQRIDLLVFLRVARFLADAWAGIDTAQVIHQDLRPANLLVVPESGEVLLVDFSMATAHGSNAVSPQDINVPAGDWAYVSPEQTGRMNRPVDYRTDCYSMGVLFYRMLTGQLPFQASDPLEWTHCHIARMPTPPSEIAPEVPQPVSAIVMKLLAKLPEDRYQGAYGLQTDLDRCLAQWQTSGRIDPFPLGKADFQERFQIPRKLYGRAQEVERLLGAFEKMTATGEAALATVSGYSGIGKSSLVRVLQSPIVARHGHFISGKFDQYQRDVPYSTLVQAFRELVRQLLVESEARIANWRQQIQEAVGVNGQLILDLLPQLELILGPQPAVPALPPTEAQNRFRMAFRQFVIACASQHHPLVLFLDDLQWIDAASMALIEHLLTHPDTRYLLLIGAYRDNEVSPAHPLMIGLQTIRHSGTPVMDLQLAPPPVMHLNQLVADALRASPASCEPLTHLVCERTEGNPFFFIQFLDALHEDGLLRHDAQYRAWQWDLNQIKATNFADNVVDLVVGKLCQLPVPVQQSLQLAACLGNTFDLRHLALVSAHSEFQAPQHLSKDEFAEGLAAAVRASLIVCADGSGKFLHDRIQQAAYSLIPQAVREEVHLHIGQLLLANMTADELAEHVFDVANQLNQGAALLIERDEKAQVAALNLRAGRQAKASAAYSSACVYLAAGMALLDDSEWIGQYQLLFSLWLERAECEFLTGRFDVAEQLIEALLRRATSNIDQAAVYHLKVLLHIVKSENPQAVDCALKCLRLFDIDLPAHPTQAQVQAEYELMWRNLGEHAIESLIDLPLMTDLELQAAMRLLSALFDAAYFTDFRLFCLHLCRMVNISLQHGITGAAAYACGFIGFILGPVFHRYQDGYRFAKLGCDLVEKHDFLAYRGRVYFAMGQVAVWTQPIASAIDFNRAAFRAATEAGDLTFACYSAFHIVVDRLLRNDALDAVSQESDQGLAFVRTAGYSELADLTVSQQCLIATLKDRPAALPSHSDAEFDEAAVDTRLTAGSVSARAIGYWIHELQARFLMGDYLAAVEAFQQAKPMLQSIVGQIWWLDYFYYAALTVAALYEDAPRNEQTGWRELLSVHCEQLREWADNYPPTFGDKHTLVSAEIARIEGRDADAMRLYEEAIQTARRHGFVQNEGIANELAARFYVSRGSTTAGRAHLDEARSCFTRWGAHGKVQQLDESTSPPRASSNSLSGSRSATSPHDVAKLDLLSVTKASQAISGQILLEDLIDSLMHILLENAGAQTGQLLLARDAGVVLAAEASVEQQAIHVRRHLNRTPLASALSQLEAPEFAWPISIVNYVRRSQERVLLDDATRENLFSTDHYLGRRQPKSVLCLPLVRRSALIGMLYLENNLVTHAFTPERVTVLELLASQAAISLENALLYADLQQENSERKRAEEALREQDARVRRLVDSNIIGVCFWDFAGTVTEANDAFLQIVGYSRQDLLTDQIQWLRMTPPQYRDADVRAVEELRRDGACQPYEKEYIRKDGRRIPVLVGGASLEGSQENGVAFVLNLTERKDAEQRSRESYEMLRELTSRRETAREEERKRIAREMHDELGQHLTALRMGASTLRIRFGKDNPALGEQVQRLLLLADKTMQVVRDVVASLRPAALDAGIAAALEWLAAEFSQNGLTTCHLRVSDEGLALADDRATALFRIVQETLTNIARHAEAKQVCITLEQRGLDCLLEVCDNGRGFDPVAIRRKSFGLAGMKERVLMLGGEIDVASSPGRGTTIKVRIPIR